MSDYEYKEVDEADVAEAPTYDAKTWPDEPSSGIVYTDEDALNHIASSDVDYWGEDAKDDGNELNHAGVIHEPEQDPDAVREQEAADLQAAVDRQDVVEEYTTEDDEDGVPVIQSDHSVRFVKPGPVNAVNE